jgi:hypothetical protein
VAGQRSQLSGEEAIQRVEVGRLRPKRRWQAPVAALVSAATAVSRFIIATAPATAHGRGRGERGGVVGEEGEEGYRGVERESRSVTGDITEVAHPG